MLEGLNMVQLIFYSKELALLHPFGISRWTRTHVKNVFVEWHKDGLVGYGEASPNARYNESHETAISFMGRINQSTLSSISNSEELCSYLSTIDKGEFAAKAALEMAFWDWIGKKNNQALHEYWNAPRTIGPVSSFTIGIDSKEVIDTKLKEAEPYPVLKVKLGTDQDEEIIEFIRERTAKPIWVDANEGWKTADIAKQRIEFLSDKNVQLIEQPMPSSELIAMREVKKMTPIPVIADEGFTGKEPLEELAESYTGINIKLMKMGSMYKSLKTIEHARTLGMEVMIGCMIETALANTAAGVLSMWADYADIDGFLLLKDRPFLGFTFDSQNRVVLNDLPGLGVIPV
ncbi:dipeptide epimerase [bacterium]|nr:MAG: dipeptide epimerase [bacterium]